LYGNRGLAFPNLESMKHSGRLIAMLIKEQGITITHAAKFLGVQRATMYSLFNKPVWPLHRIRVMEQLLRTSLADHYPQGVTASSEYPRIYTQLDLNLLQEALWNYENKVTQLKEEIASLKKQLKNKNAPPSQDRSN